MVAFLDALCSGCVSLKMDGSDVFLSANRMVFINEDWDLNVQMCFFCTKNGGVTMFY
jgi:hypothetical protein